jgi:hypothetical protein
MRKKFKRYALLRRDPISKPFNSMAKHRANAWHLENIGFRFAGQMPREIVFPWMLVKPGRNRSQKR